eukprot:6713606-Alexandrium_andersonii.AAC.1
MRPPLAIAGRVDLPACLGLSGPGWVTSFSPTVALWRSVQARSLALGTVSVLRDAAMDLAVVSLHEAIAAA